MIERREYKCITPWVVYISELLIIIAFVSLFAWVTEFYVFFSIFFVFCFIRRTDRLVKVLKRQRNLRESFHMKKFLER